MHSTYSLSFSIAAVIGIFLVTLLLATFPGWYEEEGSTGSIREVKPFPSKTIAYSCLAIMLLASGLGLVSVLWQHTVSEVPSWQGFRSQVPDLQVALKGNLPILEVEAEAELAPSPLVLLVP
jgi:hypothetical protein